MKQYQILSILFSLTAIASLADTLPLPPLFDPPNEKGGLVMGFHIEAVAPDEHGNPVLTVAAFDGKQRAAFEVIVEKEWKFAHSLPGHPSKGERIPHFEHLTFKSVGPATEVFARAYARACRIKVKRYDFSEFRFEASCIGSDPRKMGTEPVRLFLSQGALGAKEYFTIYCAIDLPTRTFMLFENDGSLWHPDLVRVFTGERCNKSSELE